MAVLIKHLPEDSATMRAIDPASQWSTEAHLLAGIFDQLAVANWLMVQVNKKKSQSNPRPQPIPRPGDAPTKSVPMLSGQELNNWLKEM